MVLVVPADGDNLRGLERREETTAVESHRVARLPGAKQVAFHQARDAAVLHDVARLSLVVDAVYAGHRAVTPSGAEAALRLGGVVLSSAAMAYT